MLPLSLEDELRVVVEGGEVLVVAGPQPLPHEAHVHGLLHLGQVQLLQHHPQAGKQATGVRGGGEQRTVKQGANAGLEQGIASPAVWCGAV